MSQSRELETFLLHVKGAVTRFEKNAVPACIGFADEAIKDECIEYFRKSGFCDYTFITTSQDCQRQFLVVGDTYVCDGEIVYLRACPDKFHTPSHKDYMGAIMNLGLERKMFGDIIVTDENNAFFTVWNKGDVLPFLYENFTSCGRAKIKLEQVSSKDFELLELQYVETDVVTTSLRADCIVSAITGMSRSQSKEFISDGGLKLNSRPVSDVDRVFLQGDVFSLKRYGKYRFDSFLGQSRRDRMRIRLLKYGNYIERK